MKTLSLLLIISITASAFAETVISQRTVILPVDVSSAKVVITNAGYGNTFLVKILVPALAGPTLMNHRNEGESAPCMATYETNQINDVIKNQPGTIQVPVKIELVKDASVYAGDNLCHVILTENVSAKIHGFNFVHTRSTELPTRDPADCQ